MESQLRANKLQTSTYQELLKVLAISELLEKNVINQERSHSLKVERNS